MKKTVCIVNYNTPELTRAAIRSISKHGGDGYEFIVFDNSDKTPFGAMDGVDVVDNTKGQIINFADELKKYPKKNVGIGCAVGCNFGSVKHMMSVEWLLQNTKEPFMLCDSDILVRESIEEFFDDTQAAIGKIHTNNPLNVPRLEPMLCWLNAPMLREAGIHYFDPTRSWGLLPNRDDKNNWYDTGASVLEDIKAKALPWREVDIDEKHIYHLGSGSWKNAGTTANEWLEQNRDLWDDTPYEKGINDVAICAIVRLENRYLREWVQWYLNLGVKKFFIYDNSKPGDERPAEVLQDYIERAIVDIVPWNHHEAADRQCPAYNECYQKHGREYAWMGFLDIDEFVMLKKHKTLPELLNQYSDTADVVVMHWMMMGDSGLTHYDPRPMWERFTKPAPQKKPEMCHVKSWVRGGISGMGFLDPHCPAQPQMKVVNPNGTPQQQKSISDNDEKSVAYIAHYFTKTAEEYVWKNQRGYPNPQEWTEKRLATCCDYFFSWNSMTDEKVEILQEFYDKLPNHIKMMEHITKQSARWGYTKLIADPGYLIRSKQTGQTYQEITVPNPNLFETVEDPAKKISKPKARKSK